MRPTVIILGMALCTLQSHAQNKSRQAFDEFRKEIHEDFQNFRRQCMQEYIGFVRQAWQEFGAQPPKPVPEEKPVPPLVLPKEEQEKAKPIESRPIVIKDVLPPIVIDPQPLPIEPIKEVPVVEQRVKFTFFGTEASVRFEGDDKLSLARVDENSIADGLQQLSGEEYDNMVIDCLALRSELQLSDWAYLQMLKALSQQVCGKGSNEATLLMAYLYMQSGYHLRFALNDGRLYMLYASRHTIYNQPSYGIDGVTYYGVGDLPDRLHICQASFPQEKPLSLLVSTRQLFATDLSDKRTAASERYPDFKAEVAVNKNLLDFYSTYPTSCLGDNICSRWAMYANTPIDDNVRRSLYPTFKELLKDLPVADALGKLLNWVQTAFVYEYDDKVWGGDRAFFADETLYYPYCDCEDRSILLTRIVRDLLGLKCALVYYPGHLATAIAVGEDAKGDYIRIDGTKYTVCDPTYIGAPIGVTMPGMDNKAAKVIVLR